MSYKVMYLSGVLSSDLDPCDPSILITSYTSVHLDIIIKQCTFVFLFVDFHMHVFLEPDAKIIIIWCW